MTSGKMAVRHRQIHQQRDRPHGARQWGGSWGDDARKWGEGLADDARKIGDGWRDNAEKWGNDVKSWGNDRNPSDDSNKQRAEEKKDDDDDDDEPRRKAVHKTVYETLEATFEGEVAGYKTLSKEEKTKTEAPKAKATAADKDDKDDEDDEPKHKSKSKSEHTTFATETGRKQKALETDSESSVPTAISKPKLTKSLDDVLAKETDLPTATHRLHTANEADITSAARSSASSTSSSDSTKSTGEVESGTSAGAKAGIAFGVLGGILMIGLIVFFILNRRKKKNQREPIEDDDEKLNNMSAAPAPATYSQSNPKAPRLSLRPVTQFFPGFNNNDKRTSKGAAMSLSPNAAAGAAARGGPFDRPSTSQSTHSANPFGNSAERVPSPISEERSMHNKPMPPSPTENPFANPATTGFGAAAGGAAGAAGAALARKTSMRRDGPKKLDLTLAAPLGPPSPAGTEFSDTPETPGAGTVASAGANAIAAAGGPANTSVHRVQLDFGATLEDEMDLKAGQLVRMLHEYDDGWALCIRLDRSQQGVVPRTCLSTRPVKPRPPPGAMRNGPPVNPNGARGPGPGPHYPPGKRGPPHGMGPPGRPRGGSSARPQSPAGGRPMSPYGAGPGQRNQSPMRHPMGRPQSPGPRAQSPGPRMQGPPGGRPQSPSGMSRRMSPPGPSPMSQHQRAPSNPLARKPVPGQAL